tara:strand:- start:533 stop:1213 length:681 start_codon:yes stop_codon:yes gene_type:complete
LAKRLTNKQKEDIAQSFIEGKTVDDLSKIFKCTNLTISRNLKKTLGEIKYKEIIHKNNNQGKYLRTNATIKEENTEINLKKEISSERPSYEDSSISLINKDEIISNSFFEIPPLDCEIDNKKQKDLSSTPLSQVELPDVVYMIVDKKIELEIKLLKDYPSWEFLSDDELNRKTIQIYLDKKNAKISCNKEQTVIKVPNSNVFRIVAPLLQSRGITRIVSDDQLIAL